MSCLTISTQVPEHDSETSDQIFTFAKPNSFIRIDTNNTWNILKPRELVFQFRTDRAHGLLCYQTVVNPVQGFPVFELYVMLENGRLKIIHEFGSEQKSFFIGQGLNHDQFHTVKLTINPLNGSLTAVLDNLNRNYKNNGMTITLTSLVTYLHRKAHESIHSVIFFGGLDPKRPISHQQYSVKRFFGCIGKIQFSDLSDSPTQASRTKAKFVSITDSAGLKSGCVNLCRKENLCANSAPCINHYTYTGCDCFSTKREDWHCRSHNISVLTLRGYSFISYKLYNFKDKVHSDVNRISFHFKSQTRNQILVYARGEQPIHNYIAIHLKNGIFNFRMDLGGGAIEASVDQMVLSDNKWHNITVNHHLRTVNILIDTILVKSLQIPGTHHHLHVDPGNLLINLANQQIESLTITQKYSSEVFRALDSKPN